MILQIVHWQCRHGFAVTQSPCTQDECIAAEQQLTSAFVARESIETRAHIGWHAIVPQLDPDAGGTWPRPSQRRSGNNGISYPGLHSQQSGDQCRPPVTMVNDRHLAKTAKRSGKHDAAARWCHHLRAAWRRYHHPARTPPRTIDCAQPFDDIADNRRLPCGAIAGGDPSDERTCGRWHTSRSRHWAGQTSQPVAHGRERSHLAHHLVKVSNTLRERLRCICLQPGSRAYPRRLCAPD
jgi:hypothetical protein